MSRSGRRRLDVNPNSDEYEDEHNSASSSRAPVKIIQPPEFAIPYPSGLFPSSAVDVHDPRAHICPCFRCTNARNMAVTVADSGRNDPHLKCLICLSPTVQGGPHFASFLVCGHVYGHKCILAWLTKKSPPTCPVCNMFTLPTKIITLIGESALDDGGEESRVRVNASNKREDRLREKVEKFEKLTDVLCEGMKLYKELVTPIETDL